MEDITGKMDRYLNNFDSYFDEELVDLYEYAPCGYITILPDGIIIKLNNTFCTFVGQEKNSLEKSQLFHKLLSETSSVFFQNHFLPLSQKQKNVNEVELDLVDSSGSLVPVLINSTQVKDNHGQLKCIRMSVFNITERKKHEHELKLSNEKVQAFYNKLKLTADFSQKISASLELNKTLNAITEMTCAQISDGCIIDLFFDQKLVRVAAAHSLGVKNKLMHGLLDGQMISDVILNNHPMILNEVWNERGNHTYGVEIEILDIFDVKSVAIFPLIESGKRIGAISFINTESFRPFSEAYLVMLEGLSNNISSAIQKARLFEKNTSESKVRYDLISLCTHEIRTPLTSMKLHIQSTLKKLKLLESTAVKKADVEKIMAKLNQQMDVVTKNVEKMFELNEINQKIYLEKEHINFTALVYEVLNQFFSQFKNANCQIRTASTPDILVHVDPKLITKVVNLLFVNALRNGKGRPVEVAVSEEKGEAILSIKDYGAPVELDHAHNNFSRLRTELSAIEVESFQLEFKLSRTILEEHGGTLVIESNENGNVFKIYLPLAS